VKPVLPKTEIENLTVDKHRIPESQVKSVKSVSALNYWLQQRVVCLLNSHGRQSVALAFQ